MGSFKVIVRYGPFPAGKEMTLVSKGKIFSHWKLCFLLRQIDAHPFKHWYESHYGLAIGVKKGKKAPPKEDTEVRSSLD